jgi:hypothetical protein
MGRALELAIAFGFCAAANAQIQWVLWDPMAVRADRTEPARLEIQLDTGGSGPGGSATAVRLDFAGGGSLTLTPLGSGRFSAMVAAAQLLYDYKADDVNHNFVGFVVLLDASNAVISSGGAFVNVFDMNIPPVLITARGNDARQTGRILNLHRPLIKPADVRTAVQQFYAYFPDDFDFVQVVFSAPSYNGYRYHAPIRNDVSGIGQRIFNATSQYGSAGRLLGINVFPIDSSFDAGAMAFSHETGHQWINYVQHPRLTPGPHWPPSTMASGVMGFNIPGVNAGGQFPYAIEPAGTGLYRVTACQPERGRDGSPGCAGWNEFSDFDLYLMGLLPASQVSPGVVLEGTMCQNCSTMAGTTITVQDIIATHGPRLPDPSTSQKSFRVGTVVISRDRLLNDDEMALLEYFAARGETKTALPFSSGFEKGTAKPFYVATRGLATVDLRLAPTPKRRAVAPR